MVIKSKQRNSARESTACSLFLLLLCIYVPEAGVSILAVYYLRSKAGQIQKIIRQGSQSLLHIYRGDRLLRHCSQVVTQALHTQQCLAERGL